MDFDKRFGKQEFRYGFEAYHNIVNSSAYTTNIISGVQGDLNTRYPDGGSTMSSIAAYATHTWEISEKLILNDGIRLTNVDLKSKFIDQTFMSSPTSEVKQNNTALNGNIGLIYMPTNDWRFTAITSTGFRAPNVDDMSKVFESVQGRIIIPNPNLKPEYTYNAELGISKVFNERVTLHATGYYTHYVNALTVQATQFNGMDSIVYNGVNSQVTSTTNAGRAYIYGIEGGLSGNLNSIISVYSTLNYTYGRIKTDTTDYPLDHIPPVFGKVGFTVKVNKFKGDFFTSFSDWKYLRDYNIAGEDNIAYATPYGMPAWYTLNARLTYHFNKNISIQAACENILDQNYRVYASNISSPGRNFMFTLRGSF
jgi:hemoglobin/transferrin/lactoferrin receptor protein